MNTNSLSSQSERVYALDALRGIMMLLGIVIHAGMTYGANNYGATWPLKDPNNSLAFDSIVAFIHIFRMPVFFVVAGFFSALLFYKKGPNAMLLNRFKRILLPFLAGVLIIYPLIVLCFAFSTFAFAGAKTPFGNAWDYLVAGKFLPFNVGHLWFLYFLVMYAVTGWLLAKVFQRTTTFTTSVNNLVARIFQNFWWRLLCIAFLSFGCLYWMGTSFIITNNDWRIIPSVFVTYFIFFGAGWMIYKTDTLMKLTIYAIPQLSAATLLFLINDIISWPSGTWAFVVHILFTSISISLFIFGFIAFFLKYFNTYSKSLNYLMDASYWVYIIHLPVVALIPGLLVGFPLPAFIKFAITLIITSIICMVSYKYLVRGSFIGMFLNGKVYKQQKAYETRNILVRS